MCTAFQPWNIRTVGTQHFGKQCLCKPLRRSYLYNPLNDALPPLLQNLYQIWHFNALPYVSFPYVIIFVSIFQENPFLASYMSHITDHKKEMRCLQQRVLYARWSLYKRFPYLADKTGPPSGTSNTMIGDNFTIPACRLIFLSID